MPENKDNEDGVCERIRNPKLLQEMYVRTAKEELPHTIGEAYANAVVCCLQGHPNGGEESQGGSRIVDTETHGIEESFADPIIMYKNIVEQLAIERLNEQ